MSTRQQTTNFWDVLERHPILCLLLDREVSSIIIIKMVRSIFIHFDIKHVPALCVFLVVEILLPFQKSYINLLLRKTFRNEIREESLSKQQQIPSQWACRQSQPQLMVSTPYSSIDLSSHFDPHVPWLPSFTTGNQALLFVARVLAKETSLQLPRLSLGLVACVRSSVYTRRTKHSRITSRGHEASLPSNEY